MILIRQPFSTSRRYSSGSSAWCLWGLSLLKRPTVKAPSAAEESEAPTRRRDERIDVDQGRLDQTRVVAHGLLGIFRGVYDLHLSTSTIRYVPEPLAKPSRCHITTVVNEDDPSRTGVTNPWPEGLRRNNNKGAVFRELESPRGDCFTGYPWAISKGTFCLDGTHSILRRDSLAPRRGARFVGGLQCSCAEG
jgi:hypothetical protein